MRSAKDTFFFTLCRNNLLKAFQTPVGVNDRPYV